jgi:hypothetical protein
MDNPCIVGIIFLALVVGAIDLGWCALQKYMKKKSFKEIWE